MVTQQRRSVTDVMTGKMVVRRLTPKECERLQGFPDDWTKIPYRGKPADECPDGPRYKAIGNSMAVPVMRWIFERMEKVEQSKSSSSVHDVGFDEGYQAAMDEIE